ncbi:hypothetical protein J6R97_06265 [bacterium]|nr:hypothetical protein [bacterium]
MANLELSNLTAKQFVATSKVLDEKAVKLESLVEDVKAGKVSSEVFLARVENLVKDMELAKITPEALGKEVGMSNLNFSYSKERFALAFDYNNHQITLDAPTVNDAIEELADIMEDLINEDGASQERAAKGKKKPFKERFKENWKHHMDATGGHYGQQTRYEKGSPPGAAAIGDLVIVLIRSL